MTTHSKARIEENLLALFRSGISLVATEINNIKGFFICEKAKKREVGYSKEGVGGNFFHLRVRA